MTSWHSYRQRNRSVSWRFRGLRSTRQGPGTPLSPVHHHNPPSRSQLSLLDSTVLIDHQSRQVTSSLPSSPKTRTRYHDHNYHGCHSSLHHHAPHQHRSRTTSSRTPPFFRELVTDLGYLSHHDTTHHDTTRPRHDHDLATSPIRPAASTTVHHRFRTVEKIRYFLPTFLSPLLQSIHTHTYTTPFSSPSIDTTKTPPDTTDTTACVNDLSRWVFMG